MDADAAPLLTRRRPSTKKKRRAIFEGIPSLVAINIPLFWIVLGGKMRTPLMLAGGGFGIYLLWRKKLHKRLGRYGRLALPGVLLAAMGFCRPNSDPLILPIWYVLAFVYCVPAGIYLAHCVEESEASLDAIFAGMMLLFGLWDLLVMRQLDLSTIVRMTQEVTTRLEQRYPVEVVWGYSVGTM